MRFYSTFAQRIDDEVFPRLTEDYQFSVLKLARALEANPKGDGCEPIENVLNGYRVRCPDKKDVEILYIVDDAIKHVFVFGVYLVP